MKLQQTGVVNSTNANNPLHPAIAAHSIHRADGHDEVLPATV